MFQLFQNPRKSDQQSTSIGLGLSYCKAIIQKMDGRISISSEEGSGSTISFTIVVSFEENDIGLSNSAERSYQSRIEHFDN